MPKASAEELTGQSRIVVNVLTSWGSYLVFFIAGFVLPHTIDENLGQEMLGIWDFAWSLVNYLSLSAMGIASSLNRFVAIHRAAGEPDKVQTAASTVFVIQCALSVVVLVAACVIALNMPSMIGLEGADLTVAQWVFLLLGASLAVQFLFDTSRGVLTGCHRWDLHSLLNAGTYLVAVVVMISLLLAGYSLLALGITYLCMQVCLGLIRHIVVMRICPEAGFSAASVSMEFARTILVFGGKSILLVIWPAIIIQTTFFLVMTNLGPAVLAILARPMALIRHSESFLARFTNMLIPMAGSIGASDSKEALHRFAILSTRFGFAFTVPVVAAFCIYGDEIVRLWMGDDYVDRAIIFTVGLGYLLPLAQTAIVRVLTGINEHGRASVVAAVGTLVTYGATYLFVSGSTTPSVWAWLIVVPLTLVNGIIVPVYACLRIGLGLMRYFREGLLMVGLSAGTTTLIMWTIDVAFEPTGFWVLPNLALYGVLTLILYWFAVLTPTMRTDVSSGAKRRIRRLPPFRWLTKRMLDRYRNTIPVLAAHGVANPDPSDEWTPTWPRVSTDQLDAVMRILSRRYEFISIDEAVDMISGKKPLRSGCLVVTFDDGYENNLSVALPILRRYQAPLNVFIATRMLVQQVPYWIDRIDFALHRVQDKRHRFETSRFTFELEWQDSNDLSAQYREFRHALHAAYDDDYELMHDIEQLALELERKVGASLLDRFEGDKWSAIISEAQLRELPADVIIGSHTMNHVRASSVKLEEFTKEVADSKRVLEQAVGRCEHFCYPLGVHTDETAICVRDCGYASAFTSDTGTNRVGDDLYKLKRVSFPQETSEAEVLYHLLKGVS